jgi:PAS domain S-box-containing protein
MFRTLFERKERLAFALAFAVLAGIGGIDYYSTVSMSATAGWVTHTHQVLKELERLTSLTNAAENTVRGYVITGEKRDLDAYQAIPAAVRGVAANLVRMTADDPDRQRDLATIPPLLEQQLQFLDRVVGAHDTNGFTAASDLLRGGSGQSTMYELTAIVRALERDEQLLLRQRSQRAESMTAKARRFSRLGSVLAFVLLAGAGVFNHRHRTARERAEAARQASEQRTRLIIDTAYDPFIAMAADGRITEWNRQAEAVFGWKREDAVGRPLAETIIPPHLRNAHTRGLAHFLATGEGPVLNRRIEMTALHRDDHEVPVELTIVPVRIGETLMMSSFVRDITERKRGEAALTRAKEEAEAANRAKSDFLANMSHEIRTPMNGIIGMTELALDANIDPDVREYLGMVKSSADALLDIINDILDFSKIEAGKLDLDVRDFDLRAVLADTLRPLAMRAQKKGLELAFRVHPDVPVSLVGDPGRLRQIIVNLVGNAIKFTERGDVTVEVDPDRSETGLEHDAFRLHVVVRDTGIGVPVDRQRSIFNSFEQADGSTHRKYGGTGLGLAISERLVALMNGRIWVESREGEGSQFHFTLDLRIGSTAVVVDAPPAELHDRTVLVIDDNAVNRRILEEMLLAWGMRPTLAESATIALAELKRAVQTGTPFAVALVDAHMPGMDGFELLEQMRADPTLGVTAVMMLTSDRKPGHVARCRALAAADYLVKPIARAELFASIGLALGAQRVTAPQAETVVPASHVRPLRVLLAEDNVINQHYAVRLLEKRGHTVLVAADGKQALEALARETFDCVLMDVQMPELDGLETTAVIRARETETGRHQRIIAMTANAMQGDRERCMAAGMDGYIAKPIRPDALIDALEREEHEAWAADVPPESPVLDTAELLERTAADAELVREMVRLFRATYPGLLSELRGALEDGDETLLARTAHNLRGSIGILAAPAALRAAERLESLGRRGELAEGRTACDTLAVEIERLDAALDRFA